VGIRAKRRTEVEMNIRKKSEDCAAGEPSTPPRAGSVAGGGLDRFSARAQAEGEQSARPADDRPDTLTSSQLPRVQAKTLQPQLQELHKLVDDAMANLEQVRRAVRWLEKGL
jgi:hypothetical protein